ncbi:serine hydrolase domain-containing protein [Trichoderma sp. SZMC 28012]
MRFLCLHGRGTSRQIFEMQTVRLREALSSHEFVFIDGIVETEPSEGAEAVADEFFAWFDKPISQAQSQELLLSLVDFIANNGPFQGIMGFSEGGIVAAMLLAEDARQAFAGFQCGILLSAAPPLDPAGIHREPATLRCLNPAVDGAVIRVPTAHIVGACEPFARLLPVSPLAGLLVSGGMEDPEKLHKLLFQLCDEDGRELFIHPLGHEVPGAKSVEGLSGTIRVIERTIERAELG